MPPATSTTFYQATLGEGMGCMLLGFALKQVSPCRKGCCSIPVEEKVMIHLKKVAKSWLVVIRTLYLNKGRIRLDAFE